VPQEQKVHKSWAVATKEEGTFYDATVMDVASYPPVQRESGCMLVTPSGAVGITPDDVGIKPMPIRTQRGEPLLPGQYVVYPANAVRLPYLPDANAPGFAIHDLPSGPFKQDFGGAWPEVNPLRLVLADGPSVNVKGAGGSAGNTVTIGLPPGTRMSLKYSSTVKRAPDMELASASLKSAIEAGQHPLISPAREIVLVHAVQQPRHPVLRSVDLLVNDRAPGETSAALHGPVGVDGPSTDHVDLVATWQEVIDGFFESDVDPRDTPTEFRSSICSMHVEYGDEQVATPPATRHAFGDTKRRDVTYKAVATTRYREYFAPSVAINPANVTNESPGVVRIIRSSARPPAPKVLYTVPNFRWSESRTSAGAVVSQRSGGLRVYVDRGWFATGNDERLAVVLPPKGTSITRPELVSVWGNDPVWFAQGDLATLGEDAFVFGEGERDGFSVIHDVETAEAVGKVTVVTFKPKFHRERQLWYFDVGMDTNASYFPFVRLALARVQPYSIHDLRLSPIVLSEFTQVSARRTTTLTPSSDNSAFSISVDGVSGSNVSIHATAPGIDVASGQWHKGASGRVVKAEFQESLLARADELDFRVLGSIETLVPHAMSGSGAANPLVSFRGSLTIPSVANPSAKHRVVIREYERFATDAEEGVARGTAVITDGQPPAPYAERLVYVDTIAVTL
jgi:hypothetical protein